MEKLSVEKLREKEFAERVERIQNTMSRFRKVAYILMVIAAVFMFFTRGMTTTIMLGASL